MVPAQPVFSVEHLEDPFPLGSVTVSGGVFGYGEVGVQFCVAWMSGE